MIVRFASVRLWGAAALLAVTAALALVAHAEASLPAPDPSCAREGSVRSLNDNAPADIEFVNNTSETVQIFWLDFNGHRVFYGRIAPGGVASQRTWITHPWVVADPSGTCLTLYVTSATSATVVVAGVVAPTPTPTFAPTPTASPAATAPAARITDNRPGPPPITLFGTSLASPAAPLQSPAQLGVTVLVVVLLIVFIPFPAELFNATYEENRGRIQRWWAVHAPWLTTWHRFVKAEEGRLGGAASLAVVVVVGGILGAALDPGFGWNPHTLSLAASIALALVLTASATVVSTLAYRRRRHEDTHWHLHALPGGLAITAAGVLLSRLLNYEPGYLYGLILIATFAGTTSSHDEGREIAVSSGTLIVFSLVAWILWIPLQGPAGQPGAAAPLVFLADLLTAVFVVGIVRAVLLLIPIRFLPGHTLVRWSRVTWGLIFGLGAFAMAEIMILPESGKYLRSVAPLVTTLVLFIGFGVASVGFWAYFRYTHGPAAIAHE